jgi:hypothetical protein
MHVWILSWTIPFRWKGHPLDFENSNFEVFSFILHCNYPNMFIGQKRRTPNGFAKCEAESDFKFVQICFLLVWAVQPFQCEFIFTNKIASCRLSVTPKSKLRFFSWFFPSRNCTVHYKNCAVVTVNCTLKKAALCLQKMTETCTEMNQSRLSNTLCKLLV